MASARFDSQALLCVVLAGDGRLLDKLRREDLIPLGSRIRTRLATGDATRDELLTCLEHLLTTAGNAGLMTKELRHLLCDHAAGNYRILIGMAADLLMSAAQTETTCSTKSSTSRSSICRRRMLRAALQGLAEMCDESDPFVFPELPDEAAAALDQFLEDFYTSSKNDTASSSTAGIAGRKNARPPPSGPRQQATAPGSTVLKDSK